jgi:hypothetical protein
VEISEAGKVVVLYENELLGEGISRYIYTHTGIKASVAPLADSHEVVRVLSAQPMIVFVQATEAYSLGNSHHLNPETILVDIPARANYEEFGLDEIVTMIRNYPNESTTVPLHPRAELHIV